MTQIFQTVESKDGSLSQEGNLSIKKNQNKEIWNRVAYLGPKIWSQIQNEIKESESLPILYRQIKKWKPENRSSKSSQAFVGTPVSKIFVWKKKKSATLYCWLR